MNQYVKVSVPRPMGNAGRGITPKDSLTLIDVDDILNYPSRDGAGVVLVGDVVVKPNAYATTIYFTPGTVEVDSNGEGETDSKGFMPTVKGKHPGNKQNIREFKTNWLSRNCIAIISYADGAKSDILGSPTNPLSMKVAYKGNKDSSSNEFTFEQISKGDDIGIYEGTIPYETPVAVIAAAATVVPFTQQGQYQLSGGAAKIASVTGAADGSIFTLLGVTSGVAPTIEAAAAPFLLKNGKTFTASTNSQITFRAFADGAASFKYIEVSRYEA